VQCSNCFGEIVYKAGRLWFHFRTHEHHINRKGLKCSSDI